MRISFVAFGLAALAVGCSGGATTPTPTGAAAVPSGPKAAVNRTDADLGDVDYGSTYDADFVVSNSGGAPLTLTLTRRTCDCSEVDYPREIAAGQQGTVKVRWKPLPGSPSPYTLRVDLATNDAAAPLLALAVKGSIKPLVQTHIPLPPADDNPDNQYFLDFGDKPIDPDTGPQREVLVFSTELSGFDLEARCSHPGLVVQPLQPLPAGQPVKNQVARSGYSVVVQATNKLPRGYVRETLELTVRAKDQPPRTLSLPVYGNVYNSAFTVRPEQFHFQKSKLTDGDSFKVNVTFSGFRPNETLEVVKVEPAFIEAKAEKVRSGLWQVTATIPPNNAEAALLQTLGFFEGRVVLKTPGSDGPLEVPVRLKWLPQDAK